MIPHFTLASGSLVSYLFYVPPGSPIYAGDVIVVDDNVRNLRFFAKVTEIESAKESAPVPPCTIKITAYPLGFVDEKTIFHPPRTTPTTGSAIRYPTTDDLTFLTRIMGEIEIGKMRSGMGLLEEVPISLHARILTQHMGIFATTGMGKSNFMKVLAASVMRDQPFGLLLIDSHGEYVTGLREADGTVHYGLLHYKKKRENLSVFSVRSDDIIARNRLEKLSLSYHNFLATDLELMYPLNHAQQEVTFSLLPYPGEDIIDFFMNEDVESLPSSMKTTAYLGNHPAIVHRLRSLKPDALRVIQRHIEDLIKRCQLFMTEETSSVQAIVQKLFQKKVVLIDIPQISEQGELFIVAVITRAIMDACKKRAIEGPDTRQVLIAIEEAQRVLGENSVGAQIFRELIMEGRKFGVGVCAITQQPKNIDRHLLAQMNTSVIMGLSDQYDRQIMATSAKQDLTKMMIEIQTLGQGEAIISTLGIPFPVSAKIHHYESYIDKLNQE
ncbi:MAG: ATP-binding protein [Methanomicrobiales archaeon]|jgi:DNA helicase HerA-like ATPase|nr:ATP-binding protein [Methanomicrobiales archaeon]